MHISEKTFDIKKFINPPFCNAPVYGWVWNGPVSREESDRQLLEMQRLGIKKFYVIPEPKQFSAARIPTELEPDYLTSAFMEEIKYTVEKATQMGITCWIYDEGGWPSGGACGKVLKKHPEYAKRIPECIETEFKAGSVYKKSSFDVIAAFIDKDVMIEEGYEFKEDTMVDEYCSKRELFPRPGRSDIPDISLSESTECFIELTHERYAEYLSEYIGKSVGAVFTDEPTLPRPFPVNERMLKLYEKEYGESVIPYLPALLENVKPDEKSAEVRIKWFDLCSRAFCENFLKPCKKWANEHGMEFTGHMDRDNVAMGSMYGGNMHLLRSLRSLDIPGVDVIWRQIFPGQPGITCASYENPDEPPANGFFPRYASSAAVQIGTDASMTESVGVYGNGVTYEQMRFVFGHQAIRGVNVFNPLMLLYDRSNYLMAGELPVFREDQAFHADLSDWNLYLERLSYITSVGKRVCDTALYYPIRNIWAGVDAENTAAEFEKIGWSLEAKQIDFDIIDDDILEDAKGIEKGEICYGKACYKKVVLPPCKYLSEKSIENLEIFKANGGEVYYGDDKLSRPSVIVSNADGLQIMHRKTETQDIYCLFNGETQTTEYAFDFGGKSGYYVNVTEGKLEPLTTNDNLVKVRLNCGETGAICLTDDIPKLVEKICPTRVLEINNFTFRRLKSFEIGEVDAKSYDISEEPVKIQLGDWADVAGKDFSGSALYETTFTIPEEDYNDVILDLGDVRYTSEVILNGKPLGKKIVHPYSYTISKELLEKENILEIIVKNTPGNQFYYTKTFDKWPDWMITGFYKKAKNFDKETLSSGLYGSVKILY